MPPDEFPRVTLRKCAARREDEARGRCESRSDATAADGDSLMTQERATARLTHATEQGLSRGSHLHPLIMRQAVFLIPP
jgi:hypothetical protein